MTEFLRFTVDTDEVLLMVSGEILQCKIYQAGGAEIARSSRGLITSLAKRQVLPEEIVPFEYPYDIAWKDQLSIKLADSLQVLLPSDKRGVLFEPGSSLIFNILSESVIPATPYADTRFSYHTYLFNGDYARYTELRAKDSLRPPVKIEDTFQEVEEVK
ncbi:unnamed protein product [marine sediment metagenome]|uniref:Uncharacterized protein n=1 Tax=marine sediment metagenome TaxID=412755 RepID=X1M8H1_9ZZZZ